MSATSSTPTSAAAASAASPQNLLLIQRNRMPKPNSALSSNRLLAHVGPVPLNCSCKASSANCRRRSKNTVAFAIYKRSPNSCVSSLMYAVSPQPAQALKTQITAAAVEYPSPAYARACCDHLGSPRKKSQFSAPRRAAAVADHVDRLVARIALALHRAHFTHNAHPVQSSAPLATYSVLLHRLPLRLGPLERRRRFIRKLRAVHLRPNTACGQTITHLPH